MSPFPLQYLLVRIRTRRWTGGAASCVLPTLHHFPASLPAAAKSDINDVWCAVGCQPTAFRAELDRLDPIDHSCIPETRDVPKAVYRPVSVQEVPGTDATDNPFKSWIPEEALQALKTQVRAALCISAPAMPNSPTLFTGAHAFL